MASRRKSSIPCMIRLTDVAEQDDFDNVHASPKETEESRATLGTSGEVCSPGRGCETVGRELAEKQTSDTDKLPRKQQGGYECKYCPFFTQNLNDFKEHVDSSHPNVILNPLYLCAVCNFNTKKFDCLSEHNEKRHPGETNFKFKRIKVNNQTVLEQTIEGITPAISCDASAIISSLNKSTTLKTGKFKGDKNTVAKGVEQESPMDCLRIIDPITAITVNGTVIIPEVMVNDGLSHVTPLLQRPPNFNSIPKIAVPLNTTKYNPSLDSNMTLITSFNKFPYPTHAELSWLTAASKHPEEQIKVWFTTQRLKQGITWSPEEVEEARKKMFNGSIPPVHQTFTVLPHPVTKPTKQSQPLLQTVPCQVLGQSNLVLTTVTNGSAMTCSPIALTVPSQGQAFKRPLPASSVAPEIKRPLTSSAMTPESKKPVAVPVVAPEGMKVTTPAVPSIIPPEFKRSVVAPVESKRPMAGPVVAHETKQPVAASIVACESKRPIVAPIVAPDINRSLGNSIITSEMKRPMATPSIPQEAKRSVVPSTVLVDTNQLIPKQTMEPKQVIVAPVLPSEITRPTIIQSVKSPNITPSVPSFSLETKKSGDHIMDQRTSCDANQFPEGANMQRLSKIFGDLRHSNHKGILQVHGDFVPKDSMQRSVPTQFPLLDRVKGKSVEQLKVLEETFQRSSYPTQGELQNLVRETRLSQTEIDCWFSERRALRDNLEQAVLNSMGSKKAHQEEQQRIAREALLNGAHVREGRHRSSSFAVTAPATCSASVDSKSLQLLKDVFAQTRWPSPDEYNQLEIQTGLARTEIVRWFKDNRLLLKSGALEWMELFQKMGGQGVNGQSSFSSGEHTQSVLQHYNEGKTGRQEAGDRLTDRAGLSSQEITDWFTNNLGQKVPETGKNGSHNGLAKENPAFWVQGTKRVDGRLGEQELVSEAANVVKTPLEG